MTATSEVQDTNQVLWVKISFPVEDTFKLRPQVELVDK